MARRNHCWWNHWWASPAGGWRISSAGRRAAHRPAGADARVGARQRTDRRLCATLPLSFENHMLSHCDGVVLSYCAQVLMLSCNCHVRRSRAIVVIFMLPSCVAVFFVIFMESSRLHLIHGLACCDACVTHEARTPTRCRLDHSRHTVASAWGPIRVGQHIGRAEADARWAGGWGSQYFCHIVLSHRSCFLFFFFLFLLKIDGLVWV